MAQRPNTSSGPRFRNNSLSPSPPRRPGIVDNSLSRDDLALGLRAAGQAVPRQYGSDWRPPVSSAETASPQFKSAMAPNASMLTFSSMDIPIGMAIGSPTHEPTVYTGWQPQHPAASSPSLSVNPEPRLAATVSSSVPSPQRAKSKRTRFGGWFRSKKAVDLDDASKLDGIDSLQGRLPDRSNTTAQRSAPKHKPIIIRSQTAPIASTHFEDAAPSRPRLGYSRGLTDAAGAGKIGARQQPSISFSPAPMQAHSSPHQGNLLDVEIPQHSMERYSIMFGGLLGPQPASSLLARRQATLDRLKTIRDEVAAAEEREAQVLGPKQRQRRVTSPQPTKSPAFSLFPPTAKVGVNAPATPRLSPLMRSNTSPALLPSPSKAKFDEQPSRRPMVKKKPVPSASPVAAATTPITAYADATIVSQPLKPVIASPVWEMVTSQHDVSPSAVESAASLDTIATVSTPATTPSPQPLGSGMRVQSPRDRLVDTETEEALKAAAEVSIARQISISHQQRQLLRPLQTTGSTSRPRLAGSGRSMSNGLSPTSSPSSYSSPSLDHIKKGARAAHLMPIAATKTATPTLVVPRESLESQRRQNRKSEWVMLETA
jgi:hypothetical protein